MSETYELKAEMRDGVGKGAARAVRRQGKIPAVIYGDKTPPISIALPSKETTLRLHAGGFLTHVATLDVDGEKIRVIPKDYQLDPVRDFVTHVDFLRVSAGTRLTLDVPVHFVNHAASPGLKRGGALNVVRHAIELYVPADAIPEAIEVDLSGLDIGDGVHISAVTLPEGVTPTITDRDFTIATIAGSGGAAGSDDEGGGENEGGEA
ncbi:MAG: 50S ribosomal protein L25/general stress protein Ctc [Pseudomonadota bacterium]|nr:50S ribosomal protein L25/general stress protein Ctc [Pseudomonadota bacterium]